MTAWNVEPPWTMPLLDPEWDELDLDFSRWPLPQMVCNADFFLSEQYVIPLGWEDAERHARKANRLHSAYLTDEIIAARSARRKLLKEAVQEAAALEKIAREFKRRLEEAKQAERRARREAERARYEAETAEWRARTSDRRRWAERKLILSEQWGCAECKGDAEIGDWGEHEIKYRIHCLRCDRIAFVEHERVMEVVNAKYGPGWIVGFDGA